MDFGSWSPSHTILALFIVAGFIGQVAVLFYRVGQTEKRLARSEERAEKRDAELLALIDKRFGEVNQQFGEVNQRFDEVNQRIDGLRSEMNQRIDGLRTEMNQRLSDMNAEIAEVRTEMRQLNQNHIDHLTHHHSN